MILNFEWRERYYEDLFVQSESNTKAIEWLQKMHLWPKNQLIICGPKRSGKSHLASIWAKQNYAQIIKENDLNTEICGPFVVDQIDNIDDLYIKFLFSIAVSKKIPALWIAESKNFIFNLKTPDTQTRMKSLITVQIESPNESLFLQILLKRCQDFGLALPQDLIEYIIRRAPITYEAIDQIANIVHQICLTDKRNPSIDLGHTVISQLKQS